MPGTTPTYGLRYQELGDAPDGAGLGETLAGDVEAQLERIDTDVSVLQGVDAGTRLDALDAPWQESDLVWKAGTTMPDFGSTGYCKIRRQIVGHTVHFSLALVLGGTGISLGSGNYSFTLPELPADPVPGAFAGISQTPNRQYVARFASSDSDLVIYKTGTVGGYGNTEAAADGWGNGTNFLISGTYEI